MALCRIAGWKPSLALAFLISLTSASQVQSQHTEGEPLAEAPLIDPSDEEARSLFSAGRTAYQAGRYARALEHFQAAYDLSGRPELLYNIGLAAERTRDDARALAAYGAFVDALPDAERRSFVEARIEVLSSSEPETAIEPLAEPAPERARWPVGGFVMSGAGVAVAVGGVVVLARGVSLRDDVENAEPGTAFADVQDNVSRAPALIRAGESLMVIGLAAAVAGVVIAIVQRPDATEVSVAVGPGGVRLEGQF
ncbi:MAG: hypothetical protein AAF411_11980 [Myxococcota bacterium]